MVTTTEDNVVTPFPGAKPGPDQPRPRTRSKGKKPTKDPTAALRKRRQRAKQDRDVSEPAPPNRGGLPPGLGETPPAENLCEINAHVTATEASVTVQDAPPLVPKAPGGHGADVVTYLAAVALAGSAAWFSIRGMVVLFPGSPNAVIVFAVSMEVAKLVTAGWLAKRWRTTPWVGMRC